MELLNDKYLLEACETTKLGLKTLFTCIVLEIDCMHKREYINVYVRTSKEHPCIDFKLTEITMNDLRRVKTIRDLFSFYKNLLIANEKKIIDELRREIKELKELEEDFS